MAGRGLEPVAGLVELDRLDAIASGEPLTASAAVEPHMRDAAATLLTS